MKKKVKLTGVDTSTVTIWDEEVNSILVEVDGVIYEAYVNPDDGYRSWGAFYESKKTIRNHFPPQELDYELFEIDEYEDEECLWKTKRTIHEFTYNGNVVLRIGTDHSDSYYPYAIFSWHPENLPINKGR